MAWNTELTKRRLLDAGTRQFALHGFAGARMESIGEDAQVNKERVYRYFGNKQGLFEAVLAEQLSGLLDGLAAHGEGPAAVAELAGIMFDRVQDRPEMARLLAWESLELSAAVALETRRPACASVADSISGSLGAISRSHAEQLLLSIVSLTVSWSTLARLTEAVAHGTTTAARREALVAQVHAIAQALTERHGVGSI